MSYARVARKTPGAVESKRGLPSRPSSGLRFGATHDCFDREASHPSKSTIAGSIAKREWSLSKVSFDDGSKTKREESSGRTHAQGRQAPATVYQVLRQPGKPLDPNSRQHFERRFGHDFGGVRVHTGEMANEAASSIHAAAYTVGNDIVFANNRYSPGTVKGRLLLQHELRHVEQQRSARSMELPSLDGSESFHENQARSIFDLKVSPLTEQRIQRAPEGGDFSLGGGAIDTVGKSVFGDTSWPFLKAVFEGFVGGLKRDVQAGRAEKAKDHLKQILYPWNAAKFYGGYLLGLVLGLISPITDLVKGIIGLVKLAGSALVWLAKWSPIGVAISPERQQKIQRLQEKFAALATEFAKSVVEFAKSPRETAKKFSGFLDSLMGLALGKAREIGANAAHSIFNFLEQAFFDMGKSIGEVVGALVAQVLLLVFSDAIGNLISKGASMVGKIAEFVAGKAVKVFEWVKGLASEVVSLLRRAVKGALKLFEGLANKAIEAFDALKALFLESEALLGEEKVAAGVGKVKGTMPNIMESRMVTGTRTSPATVADLKPPKVHPSNVGKEVGASKNLGKKPELGKAPFDEPLTPSERGLTKEQLRQKHILEDVGGSQGEAYDVASKEVENAPGQQKRTKASAGIKRNPKHHVFPQELEDKEQFFSKRGFTGAHHIDNFTVELEESAHQAVHGGGNYKLGRTTAFEWNTKVETILKVKEAELGRMLKRNEIIPIVEDLMKQYRIPRKYVKY